MEKVLQKEIATQCLEKLGIYKPYSTKFKSAKTMPCFFENFGGFWVDQEPELYTMIKEVEEEKGCLVYAVTHEFLDFGECWSMLCVPRECDGADDLLLSAGMNAFYAFAYVWNKTYPDLSEMGDIVVKTFGGGIRRIG